jgi:hypothetical protein
MKRLTTTLRSAITSSGNESPSTTSPAHMMLPTPPASDYSFGVFGGPERERRTRDRRSCPC